MFEFNLTEKKYYHRNCDAFCEDVTEKVVEGTNIYPVCILCGKAVKDGKILYSIPGIPEFLNSK